MLRSTAVLLLAIALWTPAERREAAPAGAIIGRVTLRPMPALRTANRYAGSGGTASHVFADLPALAYIENAGHSARQAVPAQRPQLAQRDTIFNPGTLVVPVGTTVEFPNYDPFFHNVFSYSKPKRFDLGRYPRGESKSVTFDKPGLVNVYCEIHKWMRAVVLVADNPYHATIASDGTFTIPDVPPGTYDLVVWHADRGRKRVQVTVPAEGSARVDLQL